MGTAAKSSDSIPRAARISASSGVSPPTRWLVITRSLACGVSASTYHVGERLLVMYLELPQTVYVEELPGFLRLSA